MDETPDTFVRMRRPFQCAIWADPDRLVGEFKAHLEQIESYEDGGHLERALFRCRACGQFYFYEWYEWVDWEGGDDRQYTTLVPVETEAEIEAIRQTDIFSLMTYVPRLHLDRGGATWMDGD